MNQSTARNSEDRRPYIVGIGGSLRKPSTSLQALERALKAAEEAGAATELFDLRELNLPMFEPGKPLEAYNPSVARFIEAVRSADGLIWSTPAYHGTLAGVTKNALDYMEYLKNDDPPYLHQKVVGLIATAAGQIAAVNSINAMVFAANSLRAVVAPLLVPITESYRVFDKQTGRIDEKWAERLDQLGQLVADMAGKLRIEKSGAQKAA